MNPHGCRVALRPRGVLDVFDLTLRLLRVQARPTLLLAAIVLLPLAALASLVAWWSAGSPWVVTCVVLLGPLVQAPFTVLGGRLLFADAVPLPQVGRATLTSAGPLLGAWFLFDVLMVGCALVGVVLTPLIVYVPEAILLERAKLRRSLSRSVTLVGGEPVGAIGGAAARWVLGAWGLIAGEAVGQVGIGWMLQIGTPFGALESGQITPYAIVGLLAVQPLIALFRLMLYVDARTRLEGWDLQVGLRALGLRERP